MLILLDRDGVINRDLPQSVTSVSAFTLLPGVGHAIQRLNHAGHKVAVITNQACVGRGDLSEEDLNSIHLKMTQELAHTKASIDKIYVCTDTEIEPHKRRKPAPGMILEALTDFNEKPENTVMIGDALRDLEAAQNARCHSILVLTGKGKMTQKVLSSKENPIRHKVPVMDALPDAVDFLLSSEVSNFLSGNTDVSDLKAVIS